MRRVVKGQDCGFWKIVLFSFAVISSPYCFVGPKYEWKIECQLLWMHQRQVKNVFCFIFLHLSTVLIFSFPVVPPPPQPCCIASLCRRGESMCLYPPHFNDSTKTKKTFISFFFLNHIDPTVQNFPPILHSWVWEAGWDRTVFVWSGCCLARGSADGTANCQTQMSLGFLRSRRPGEGLQTLTSFPPVSSSIKWGSCTLWPRPARMRRAAEKASKCWRMNLTRRTERRDSTRTKYTI